VASGPAVGSLLPDVLLPRNCTYSPVERVRDLGDGKRLRLPEEEEAAGGHVEVRPEHWPTGAPLPTRGPLTRVPAAANLLPPPPASPSCADLGPPALALLLRLPSGGVAAKEEGYRGEWREDWCCRCPR
jgi:hypothetical protein